MAKLDTNKRHGAKVYKVVMTDCAIKVQAKATQRQLKCFQWLSKTKCSMKMRWKTKNKVVKTKWARKLSTKNEKNCGIEESDKRKMPGIHDDESETLVEESDEEDSQESDDFALAENLLS